MEETWNENITMKGAVLMLVGVNGDSDEWMVNE